MIEGRVSHQVGRMSRWGLVEKERSGGDRRGDFVVKDQVRPAELDAIASAAEKVLAVLDDESAQSR